MSDEENLDCDDTEVSSLTQTSIEARERAMDLKFERSLRHEQNRLLIFLHSAECKLEGGRCPLSLHCREMKKLREHLDQCKDLECTFPHCKNARTMLAHYHACKMIQCIVCGPIREEVRRSKERENLKQEGFVGGWQSDKDMNERKKVLVKM